MWVRVYAQNIYTCMYVCMYVCIYVLISRPKATIGEHLEATPREDLLLFFGARRGRGQSFSEILFRTKTKPGAFSFFQTKNL